MWLKRTLSIVGIKLVRLKQVTFFIFSLWDLSCSILKWVPSLTVHSFQLGTLEGKKKTAFTVTSLVLPLWLQPKMNSNGSPPDLGGISEGWRSMYIVRTQVYGGQCYSEQSRNAKGSTWFICSQVCSTWWRFSTGKWMVGDLVWCFGQTKSVVPCLAELRVEVAIGW